MSERMAIGTKTVTIGTWHRASGTDPKTGPPHRDLGWEWPIELNAHWVDAGHEVVLAVSDYDGCWALTTEGITDAGITAALLDFDQGGHIDPEVIARTRRLLLAPEDHWSYRGGTHGEG